MFHKCAQQLQTKKGCLLSVQNKCDVPCVVTVQIYVNDVLAIPVFFVYIEDTFLAKFNVNSFSERDNSTHVDMTTFSETYGTTETIHDNQPEFIFWIIVIKTSVLVAVVALVVFIKR